MAVRFGVESHRESAFTTGININADSTTGSARATSKAPLVRRRVIHTDYCEA